MHLYIINNNVMNIWLEHKINWSYFALNYKQNILCKSYKTKYHNDDWRKYVFNVTCLINYAFKFLIKICWINKTFLSKSLKY